MTETMRRWSMPAIGRDNLKLERVAIPEPRPGEIRVKVSAASLNYRDKLVIETGMGADAARSVRSGLRTWRVWLMRLVPVSRASSPATG